MSNILITGACGYLGSMLCYTLSKKYNILGIDNLLFNQGHLIHRAMKDVEFYNMDVDGIPDNLLENVETVIPLACLTGAPIVSKNPTMGTRVNKDSILRLIDRLNPNVRVIIASTNSGYGSQIGTCTEESPLNSVSLYGKLKEELEASVLQKCKNVVVFRLATVYGLSFRARLDLLINCLVYDAYFNQEITIFDDSFMRNYVNIQDIIRGIDFSLDNFSKMNNNIYNIGDDSINMSKMDLAKTITKQIPVPIRTVQMTDPDARNYIVSSAKLYKLGFKPQYNLDYGINELINYYSFLPKDPTERENITKYMRNDKFIAEHDN